MENNIYLNSDRIKKDLIPVVIKNYTSSNDEIYLGFVHKTSKKPRCYYDFIDPNYNKYNFDKPCEIFARESRLSEDYIEKLTPTIYFKISDNLKRRHTTYNLNKKRYEYNRNN